jgi:hypothetical protein
MSNARHIFAVTAAMVLVAAIWTPARGQRSYSSTADRLAGTYEIDRTRSDNADRLADQATRDLPPGQHDRAYQSLMARLSAPDTMSIDLQGRSVTIVSSTGPRLTFDADGRDQTETGPNGRPMTTRADVRGQTLTVSMTGNRGSDYTVQFSPVPGGLQVTRQVNADAVNGVVRAQSYYRRVSDQPRWDGYGNGNNSSNGNRYGNGNAYNNDRAGLVPDGTELTARLDRDLNSRNAREGDNFTMTVVSPGPYRDASLTGVVAHIDGGNRDNVAFDFDRIRMNNGREGRFEGQVESVRTPDGREIHVNRSGSVRDQSGYNSSNAGHAAIGATLGAIVGAIAGGGKGAAIGAVAGGAGTLLIEGPNGSTLPAGSEIRLVAIPPQQAR